MLSIEIASDPVDDVRTALSAKMLAYPAHLLNSLNTRQRANDLPYYPPVILANVECGRATLGNGHGFYLRELEPGADFIRTPGPIMFQSPGDSFVNGSLLGLCVEVPLAAIVSLAMHGVDWNGPRIAMLVATPVLIACITLLTRPVAFSTVWKHKRSPFVLDDNVRASIYGRLCGIAIGVVFGIMVATTFA
ncbi:hypothetical protein [Burkholderia sp. AU38729]|uniref:hypothetical protein n=1 Tax=Burkholderia sp. AU38729 TaxID=2879633 RepID=UPI001CF544C0|nr:hypothetical protein [Burkholderia sp. AU38729]MCA8067325.1 hypothetical protein [Burkholderia sp. AU38729]